MKQKTYAVGAVVMLLLMTGGAIFDYNTGTWPVLRHDQHNSDFVSKSFGNMSGLDGFTELAWVLREEGKPAVIMSSSVVFDFQGKQYAAITTGKVSTPNLYLFEAATGREVWRAAPPDADSDAGPGGCAITGSVLADKNGNLFIYDCFYLYCYHVLGTVNGRGHMIPKWKKPMPNLYQFNTANNLWYPVSDPTLPYVRAKPFVTMFLTRSDVETNYIGGISTDGGIFIFDPADGGLFAQSHLANPAPDGAVDWGTTEFCFPDQYTLDDDPMYYDPADGAADGLSPFGIWCTGVQPQTDDPDADYFMNPCQLKAFLSGNTVSSGSLVVNTPAVVKDPQRPKVSRIYINGAQSDYLAGLDTTPLTADAMVYRIDFDPEADEDHRLTILNYQSDNAGQPVFNGRMVNGENSGSSPAVSVDEKWLFTGDNAGNFYGFSTETGEIVWQETIGSLLGSATVAQKVEADGLFYVYTYGDSQLWVFGVDPDDGTRKKKQTINLRPYVLNNFWREDKPGYAIPFRNDNNRAYEKYASASSSVTGAEDLLILSYTVGWRDPDRPASFLVPTHTVFLFLDRLATHESDLPRDVIQAGVIDVNGTVEQAIVFTPGEDGLIGMLPYGSQAATLARFQEVNNMLPEGMEDLYVKPHGGVRFVTAIPQ